MLYPPGLSHSNRKMVMAATWIATNATNIQDAVSNGSEMGKRRTLSEVTRQRDVWLAFVDK